MEGRGRDEGHPVLARSLRFPLRHFTSFPARMIAVHNMPLIAFTCRPPCAPCHHNQHSCQFCSYAHCGCEFVGCPLPSLKIFKRMHPKFSPPSVSKDADTGKTQVLYHEPKQIDPSLILVSPLNRDGAPPNVQRIHFKKCFVDKGFRQHKALPRPSNAIGGSLRATRSSHTRGPFMLP